MIRGLKGYALYGFGFFLVIEMMLAAAIYWWPNFMENISSIKMIASPVPMLKQLVDQVDRGGVAGYVVGQHYFKGCATLGTAAAILFASGAVAGEAHRGTMELWLARPVSRLRLLTERYVLGLLAVLLPVFVSSFTIPPLLTIVDQTMDWSDLTRCSIHMGAFLSVVYSVAFFWSSLGSEPLRISFVMLFGSILTFAIYLVETITNYSLYRLVDIKVFMEIVMKDRLDWWYVIPMLALSAVLYALSVQAFRRRLP
ncbi:MAG: ABC-2 type transport system permease protein [Planctomycetota bacterium]|jgi:ABC-type transport system involved in multi-copper enzyme maturation permease subunit